MGRRGPSIPQSSRGNVSIQNLISDYSLNPRLERIFGRPFLTVVTQPGSSKPILFPIGVDMIEEVRRQKAELRKLYEEGRPVLEPLHKNPKTVIKFILTEFGRISSIGKSISDAYKAIRKEFNEFMVTMGKRPTLPLPLNHALI